MLGYNTVHDSIHVLQGSRISFQVTHALGIGRMIPLNVYAGCNSLQKKEDDIYLVAWHSILLHNVLCAGGCCSINTFSTVLLTPSAWCPPISRANGYGTPSRAHSGRHAGIFHVGLVFCNTACCLFGRRDNEQKGYPISAIFSK